MKNVKLNTNTDKWQLIYTNIRGLKSKITSLTAILHEKNPQLFLVTETQLRSNTGINIPGYTFFGRKREKKNGGGVGILVRNDIRQQTAVHYPDHDLEIFWVSMRRRKKCPLIIGTYYGKQESRTNNLEIEKEMGLLEEEIKKIKKDGEILLAMDANAKI